MSLWEWLVLGVLAFLIGRQSTAVVYLLVEWWKVRSRR